MSEQNIKQNQDINIEIFKEQEQPQKEILLKLGDIILISDPTNEILNDNVFFIEYIDTNKIKLINSKTFEKVVLHISPDRIIGDGNIQSITILSSNPESGYARQNELLPGTWINIYFGGDIPSVISGKITNLEEDMIEIQTIIDNDIIYINFAYQGIPEDLPIETFEIRPPIDMKQDELQLQTQEETEGEEKQPEEPIKVNKKISNIMNLGDIEFGDVFKVEEYVNIDKDKYRYNIDVQTNDLLEEMIANIPTNKRTNNVLNSIHVMITRFLQLREISSKFDKNKNITGIIIPTAKDRPLAEYLSEFKNTLYWIMLVAKNIKKIYQDEEFINDDTAVNEYDDVVKINIDSDLKELSNLFKTLESARYFKPRHLNYTYKSFDTLMTPFNSVNPSEENNVFTVPNGIIVEGNVESDINVIIDNLGDFYSSVATKSEASQSRQYMSDIVSRRFVIQKYNLAAKKLHATSFKGQKLIAHRVKVTENDPISINSIVTLPEPAVQFSHINLPGSNLLVKSNLNLHFLNYWELLKQKTNVTTVPIVRLDTELEYDDSNFVDNIKQYFLDLTKYKKPDDISNADIYKIFLKTIIPKTRILFFLIKKYIKGRLSLVDVVNYMEPFKIYPSDLTYNQYREINSFIYNKITEYNSTFKEYNMAFSYLKNTGFQTKNKSDNIYYFQNTLFDLLESTKYQTMKSHVMNLYGFSETKISISGSEFLKRLITSDFGNLFNTSAALTNIELMFPDRLSEVFNQDKDRLKKIMDNNKNEDKCTTFVIAKKYVSKESLILDNDKPIYYDKQYDTTNYDLIDQKYRKEKNSLSHEDFILFLTDVLQKKDRLNDIEAEYMATTLANQAKQVREGDYAILVTTNNQFEETMADQMEYYIRNNDVWVLDDKVDPNVFIKDDDILCNINYNCIYNPAKKSEDKCESISVSKTTAIQNALNQIMEQFDSNYEISKTELNNHIMKQLTYFEKIFNKIQKIKKTQFYKYNDIQYELGLSISNEIINRVVSPYIKLRDLIMGQNDFIKKQNDIIQFVSLYCYEGNPSTPNINDGEMENEWWLYCKDTNTKLLPKFHHILASTFINNNSKYDEVLNDLKRTIGKRSDDGDAWVDENSGEIICYIDLDVTEGYKDGFVDKSRAIIEKDEGEIMLERYTEKGKQEVKRLSAEGEIISNIVSTISDNMGIDIEQLREFIIRVVTELMSDTNIIKRQAVYNKIVQEKNKKGQTMMPYSEYYGSIILYLTLGVYLIAVQTSIPSVKTRKTAPGCVRSFTGFPFEGEGDDSSVEYLACVALKSRDKTIFPWNALQKIKQKDVVSTIKTTIIKIKNYHPEIQQKMSLKTEYLLINPEETIPEEHNLTKWINFLPPLKRFHVKNLTNVSSGFEKELGNDLRTGSSRQLEKILVIKSKIIAFSLAIQEQIQNLVEKKNLLMKSGGQLFMDNACCNEDSNIKITTLEYFANDDKNIELYNNVVAKLSSTMRDINLITNAKIMLSKENSKRTFPDVSNIFSEETIYYAFIMLCKFQTETPLTPELLSICNEKPDYLKKMDTIQEKITKLKNDGRIYTNEQFLRLFQIVSRHNIINISFESSTKSCIHKLEQLLNNFNVRNDENVPNPLVEKIQSLVSTYDLRITEDNEHMRTLKNYLQNSIKGMRTELIIFLNTSAKLTNKENDNLAIFIEEMSVWSSNEGKRNTDKISDDALNNYVNFMKNFIKMFVITFPSLIIKKQEYNIVYGESWDISREHYQDLNKKISEFYKPLEKFYANENITKVLNEISVKSKGIYLLSKNTPVLSNIKIGDTIFYNSFDKKITILLYEYYLLSVLTDYISLTQYKNMISRVLSEKSKIASSLEVDFLAQDQSRFADEENEFISGNILTLTQDIAKLLAEYLKIMMKSKSMINMSYDDIADKIFKLKEAEKYDFTDKLRDMTDEQREVDNIMKYNKLEFYGMFDDIRGYNDEHFKHDKQIAENVARIQNKFGQVDDDLMNDDDYENGVNRDVAEDNAVESDHDEDMNDYDNADNDYAYNDYEYD
jgi:hypothetical protein